MFGGHSSHNLEPRVEKRYATASGLGWDTAQQKYPPSEKRIRVMGVDLGQANDRSAAVVLERRTQDPDFTGPNWPYITLQKIRRYPQDADYTLQVDNILAYPDLDFLVVEYNGVGRPVVDQLRRRAREINFRGRIIPIITVGSNARLHEVADAKGVTISVPKINLVSSINLLVQSGRLKVPDPHTCQDVETAENIPLLTREMRNFEMRIRQINNAAASYRLGNVEKSGAHDDLVMSLGLAAWFMINRSRREPAIWIP